MDWSLWPGGQAGDWVWRWEAYPGVWIAILALAAGYAWALRRARRAAGRVTGERAAWRHVLRFGLGIAALWAVLDWPVGPLAAGYLLSAHTVQYLVICLLVGPLLLLGLPPGLVGSGEPPARHRRLPGWFLQQLTHPVVAAATFAGVTLVSFLPPAVEALRPHPAGSLVLVAVWLATAVLLWWPVVGPSPRVHQLSYLAGLGYLFLPFVLPKAPGVILTFAGDALYSVYATAPRGAGLAPEVDQQVAAVGLWLVGSIMVLVALAVLFFRWYEEDRRMARPDSLGIPASPEVVELLFGVRGGWAALEHLIEIMDGALPSRDTGAEIVVAVREGRARGPAGVVAARQVILELRTAVPLDVEAVLQARISREFDAYLTRLSDPDRRGIVERLDFRVIGYGSRVG